MQALSIVECLDVVEKLRSGLVGGLVLAVIDQFALQDPKEALGRRVVVPTADAVRTGLSPSRLQSRLIVLGGVLAALTGCALVFHARCLRRSHSA